MRVAFYLFIFFTKRKYSRLRAIATDRGGDATLNKIGRVKLNNVRIKCNTRYNVLIIMSDTL